VVGKDGRPTLVTSKGGCERIAIAKDHRTVSWSRATRKGSAVFIYRDGAVRKIEGTPFVREHWFVDGGRKIAVASGGLYFAGWESLYDVATLKLIDEFNQYHDADRIQAVVVDFERDLRRRLSVSPPLRG
jgi:hypothetical protein